MSKIKQVLFDFGGVLVRLHRDKWVSEMQNLGCSDLEKQAPKNGLFEGAFIDFECGRIGEQEFYEAMNRMAGTAHDQDELRRIWNLWIGEIPPYKLNLLKQLKREFPVYMVSNTNISHMEYSLDNIFNVDGNNVYDYFDKLLLSYELGANKPHENYFSEVTRITGIAPEHSLYLDDSPTNIAAGEKMGFISCLVDPEEDLEKLVREKIKEYNG